MLIAQQAGKGDGEAFRQVIFCSPASVFLSFFFFFLKEGMSDGSGRFFKSCCLLSRKSDEFEGIKDRGIFWSCCGSQDGRLRLLQSNSTDEGQIQQKTTPDEEPGKHYYAVHPHTSSASVKLKLW